MIKLTFTGDVMIGRLVNEYLRTTDKHSSIWGNTIKTLKSADLLFINLECALTKSTTQGTKDSPVFFFRSEPEHVKALVDAGVDYCALANNHTLDYGVDGLLETITVLKRVGIPHSGAGENAVEARKPADLKIDGLKFKVFSITDNEPGWEAGKSKPGTFYLPIDLLDSRVRKLIIDIRRVKNKGYFVIVSAHWGPNMVRVPSKIHCKFARSIINAGCDIFHGHSSHVFQGVEVYKEKVIFYDCGGMIDDYAVDPLLRNDESFIFEVYLDKGKFKRVVLKPILIKNLKVNIVEGRKAKSICSKMIKLCEEFNTPAIFKKGNVEI